MGGDETATPAKSEKSTSPAQEQTNVCVYPDWAAIQAYYGAGVTLPPPYYNSGVTSGHPPHPYMWGPQPLMPPYGAPYAAIYSHGGIYAHPHGSNGHGIPASNTVAAPLSIATPAKSPSNKDLVSNKKSKGFDGLAVSLGNGSAGSATGSQSEENATDASSSGSDGNTAAAAGVDQLQRKRSRESMAPTGLNGKIEAQGANAASGIAGKPSGTMSSPSITPALELDSSNGKTKAAAATVHPASRAALQARDGLPSDLWIQDERELKRERRKQSNRESARRSRLRKQAETEELAVKVDSLNAENLALKSEMNRLKEKVEMLKLENTELKEKLGSTELGHAAEIASSKIEDRGTATLSTENLLSRVNNSDSFKEQFESGSHENSNSGTKLHQLLESSSRTDPVAAG